MSPCHGKRDQHHILLGFVHQILYLRFYIWIPWICRMEFQAVNTCDRHGFLFGTIDCFSEYSPNPTLQSFSLEFKKTDIRNFEVSKNRSIKMIKKFATGIWKNFLASFPSSFSSKSRFDILWQEPSPLNKRCFSAFNPN